MGLQGGGVGKQGPADAAGEGGEGEVAGVRLHVRIRIPHLTPARLEGKRKQGKGGSTLW